MRSHFPSPAPRGAPRVYCGARWREGSPWSNCSKLRRPGPQRFPGLNKTVVFDDLHIVKETAHYRELPERLGVISECEAPSVFYLLSCLLFYNSYSNCSLSLLYLAREETFSLRFFL